MEKIQQHIVIDARIRRASTGRPVDRLLRYLPELDKANRYTVLVQADDDWQAPADNFSVKRVDYPQFSFNPLQQLTYARAIRRLKPDLVHFTMTGQQPLGYFGRQITMTHDLTMYEYVRPGRLPVWLHRLRMVGYRLLMWAAHRKAKHIITPSRYVQDGLAKFHHFSRNKIVTIYEASEPPLKDKAEPLAEAGEEFIFHVGSPFPHKNIERLVQAFEKLAADRPELRLVLAGKLEHHFGRLLDDIADSPVRDRIIVPGFISDGQLKWLYQNARAYVLPSLSEGFGLPGLEAMAHGCPLVSSNATCLPEVYGEAAHYFDPKDVGDMAAKIAEVLNDPKLRQRLVEKGYQQLKRYSWRRMAEETLEVYRSVLAD